MSGLPKDVTKDELHEFARRFGAVMLDQNTGEVKIKIYQDANGVPKGDARICYANVESVEMAIEFLNGSMIRDGYQVKVEQANFEMKGDVYIPKEAKKVDKVEQLRIKQEMDKQKAWDDHEIESQGLKVVVIEEFYTM